MRDETVTQKPIFTVAPQRQSLMFFGFDLSFAVSGSQLKYGFMGMDVFKEFVLILDGPGKRRWLHHREINPLRRTE